MQRSPSQQDFAQPRRTSSPEKGSHRGFSNSAEETMRLLETRGQIAPRGSQATSATTPRTGPAFVLNAGFALAILLGPIAFVIGAVFEPAAHLPSGMENIALNAAANPFTNGLHVAAFVAASFLLPISVLGMARLAMARSPWLATIGGAVGLIGWVPLAALAAQDDLTLQMARLGASELLGTLWERFNADQTMTLFLLTYIVGHLLAYVLLPIALHRAKVIPAWTAWLLASSSPLTIAFFLTRQDILFLAFCVAFVIGSARVAWAAWHNKPATSETRPLPARAA